MDKAYSQLDRKLYNIHKFSRLDNSMLENLRRSLICPSCDGKAWYRKESRDGKAACFNAYHNDKCRHESVGTKIGRANNRVVREVRMLRTSNAVINVRFASDHRESQAVSNFSTNNQSGQLSEIRKRHTGSPPDDRNQTRTWSNILELLIGSDEFADADNIMINTGKALISAEEFFVKFHEISPNHKTKYPHGYWGVIASVDDHIHWLNTHNELNVSIPVDSISSELIKKHKIDDPEDLAGAHCLVFGWLNLKETSTKYWINYKNDIGRLAMLKAPH